MPLPNAEQILTEEEQQKLFKLADHAMEKEGGVKSMIKNALAEEDKEAKVEVSEEPAKSAEITKTYLTDLPKLSLSREDAMTINTKHILQTYQRYSRQSKKLQEKVKEKI